MSCSQCDWTQRQLERLAEWLEWCADDCTRAHAGHDPTIPGSDPMERAKFYAAGMMNGAHAIAVRLILDGDELDLPDMPKIRLDGDEPELPDAPRAKVIPFK